MKKLILALCLLTLPAFAGTYSITTTAAQDAKLDKARLRANAQTCSYFNLPKSCTQTQAREIFCKRANFGGVTTCVPDPASTPQNPLPQICTTTPLVSNCAGANQVKIFATVAEYFDHFAGTQIKSVLGPQNDQESTAEFEAAKAAASAAQKDAIVVLCLVGMAAVLLAMAGCV